MGARPSFRISHIVVLAPLLMAVPSVEAEADGPDHFAVQGVAQRDVLNLRASPSAQAAKLGSIPANGVCLRNLGCQGGLSLQESTSLTPAQQQQRLRAAPRWCRVEYRGLQGWVAGRYLREDSSGTCTGR